MEKFSKMKPDEDSVNKKKNNTVFDNGYIELIEYEDWTFARESDMIVCIPYFIESNTFLIRNEYIPSFKYDSNREQFITILSGTIDAGETPIMTLHRELAEEAGIILSDNYNQLEEFEPLYLSKGNISKYHPFILPLHERDYQEVIPTTDGSVAEKLSKSAKIDVRYIDNIKSNDLITNYMILKLKEYLHMA